MRILLALLVAAAVPSLPAVAAAQPAAPDAAPSPVSLTDATWVRDYDKARARMLAGDFEVAAGAFERLAARAADPHDATLARELATLCQYWHSRGLVFVKRGDLGESSVAARARNERTTDEIASLYLNSVLYGLGTGGFVAVHTEPESVGGAVLPALGLAAGAAGGVAVLDHQHPQHYGVGQSIVSGLYIGLEEGIAWTIWNQARARWEDQWTEKTVANLIWASTTLGAVGGGVVGSLAGTTPGRASYVGSASLWGGLLTGLAVGSISGDDEDQRDDNALLFGAIGLNAGVLAGLLTAGKVSPSIARVRFLDLGGIGGGLVAGGLYLSATDGLDRDQVTGFMGTTAAGMAVGLGVAWFATSGMEGDRGADAPAKAGTLRMTPTLMPVPGGGMVGVVGVL